MAKKRKNKNVEMSRVATFIDQELREWLKKMADKEASNESAFIRKLIKNAKESNAWRL